MKLAAVVIVYHPTAEAITNIESYYDSFDRLFVFDNTESDSGFQKKITAYNKVSYFHDGRNRGISERLNAAARLAATEGYDWLFTLDQDSYFSAETLQEYLSNFRKFEGKESVGMFGIEHEEDKLIPQNEIAYREVDHLITSGTLVNIPVWNAIGGFDEKLFIDLVDIEYSIRVIKAGYRIIQFDGIIFSHCIGKVVHRASIKSLFLLKKRKEIHAPIRCYYMYRNSFYVQQKHKDYDPHLMNEYRHSAVDRVRNCLYYGRNAWTIIRYMIRAKSDFLHNRMGKIGDTDNQEQTNPAKLFHSSTSASQYTP